MSVSALPVSFSFFLADSSQVTIGCHWTESFESFEVVLVTPLFARLGWTQTEVERARHTINLD